MSKLHSSSKMYCATYIKLCTNWYDHHISYFMSPGTYLALFICIHSLHKFYQPLKIIWRILLQSQNGQSLHLLWNNNKIIHSRLVGFSKINWLRSISLHSQFFHFAIFLYIKFLYKLFKIFKRDRSFGMGHMGLVWPIHVYILKLGAGQKVWR